MKNPLKPYFTNFLYFYQTLRYRIVIMLIVGFLVGLLDGFGIALFLPLLELVSDQTSAASASQMGNLSFIVNAISRLGFELNLITTLFLMLFFFILKGIFNFLDAYFAAIYQQYFVQNMRYRCVNKLSQYSFKAFVSSDAGRIQNTLTSEASKVMQAYRNYMKVMKCTALILVYASLAFLANTQFAILVAIAGYLTNFLFSKLYKRTKILSNKVVDNSHGLHGLVIQYVNFFKYLKATALIGKFKNELLEKINHLEEFQKKIGIINAIMIGVREPVLIAVVIGVIIIQVFLLEGVLATIILSVLFLYRALTQIMQLQTYWNQFLSNTGSIKNMKQFEADLEAGEDKNNGTLFNHFQKSIEFKQVNFTYTDQSILKKINLKIEKNSTVALVGESGSGKTTLLNLICGLLTPQHGKILIDHTPLKDINKESYCKRIGYITQEPVIFNETIFNNVTFWDEKTTDNLNRFNNALKKANILEFVNAQPNKEMSMLGNNGINLSGGQKQRISIARELYKSVDILIMDEATSSLDSETEKTIQENIDALKGQYTFIIISHRLSTIKNADKIFLLKNGTCSHAGTYNELLTSNDYFKRMVHFQELKNEEQDQNFKAR